MGAERIIAMSRTKRARNWRVSLARRHRSRTSDEGVARIKGVDRWKRRLGAGMRRHPGIDDAGNPCLAGRVGKWACGVPNGAISTVKSVLFTRHLHGGPARCAASCPSNRLGVEWKDQPGRFRLTLPWIRLPKGTRNGRAPRD